jgi:hypothetical protein
MTQALKTSKGKVKSAAKQLSVSPSTVYHYSSSDGPIPALHGAIEDSQSGAYKNEKEKEEEKRKDILKKANNKKNDQ